jgi:hypothetical protein
MTDWTKPDAFMRTERIAGTNVQFPRDKSVLEEGVIRFWVPRDNWMRLYGI